MFEIFAGFANFPTQYILRIFNVANFRIQFPHFADFAHNFPLLATVRRFRTFPNPFHTLRRCCNLNFANSPQPHFAGFAHFPIHFTDSQIFQFRTFANSLQATLRRFRTFCNPFRTQQRKFPTCSKPHFSQVSHISQSIFTHFAKFVNWQVRHFLHFAYCSIDIFFLRPYIYNS